MNTSYTQLYKSVYEPDIWLKAAEGDEEAADARVVDAVERRLVSAATTHHE